MTKTQNHIIFVFLHQNQNIFFSNIGNQNIFLGKAFDKVPHKRLLEKIKSYGIVGPTLNWIEDFLKNRSQKVMVNGAGSEWENVTSGIPQGSVQGPILMEVAFLTFSHTCRWFSNVSSESIMTLISFSWVTVSLSCPSSLYVLVSSFLLLLIFM
jgi:hypothetical protein